MAERSATKDKAESASRPRRPPRKKVVEQAARAYFDAVARRDPEAMAACWSEDGVDEIVPVGILRGPGEVKAFFGELFAAFPDGEMTVTRLVADDSKAAVEWRMSGAFIGAGFLGLTANGRRVELRGLDLLEVEDGVIKRNTAYYDGADFARQLGLLPPLGSGPERALKGAFNALTRARRALAERRG